MRWGAAYSTIMHAAVLLLVYFGLPDLFKPEEAINQPIPVAVYVVSEETTLPPATPEPEPEPAKEPPPPEPEEIAELPPPPEPIAMPEPPPPEPVAEKTPPPEPLPPKVAEPDPEKIPPPPPPKPVQVAKAKPKPEPKAKPKPKPKPEPDPPDFSSLLVDLASKPRAQETPDRETAKEKPKPEEAPPETASTRRAAEARNEPLSLSVIDAIRRQVEDKWNVPIGALDVAELSVELRIVLQTDGAVRNVKIIDRERMSKPGEENFQAMAESARRAVWRASPLRQLPPEKYDQWREITLIFSPPV